VFGGEPQNVNDGTNDETTVSASEKSTIVSAPGELEGKVENIPINADITVLEILEFCKFVDSVAVFN